MNNPHRPAALSKNVSGKYSLTQCTPFHSTIKPKSVRRTYETCYVIVIMNKQCINWSKSIKISTDKCTRCDSNSSRFSNADEKKKLIEDSGLTIKWSNTYDRWFTDRFTYGVETSFFYDYMIGSVHIIQVEWHVGCHIIN